MSQKYARLVKFAAWAAACTASFLLLLKLFAWWYTGSMTLLASLIDSFLDLVASIINLVVIRYAIQPADENHKFGHGKAESLAALAQSAFIIGSAVFLVLNSIERLIHPSQIIEPNVGVITSAISAVITLGLLGIQKWVICKTGSQAIKADALNYQADLLMYIVIILALGLTWYGLPHIDASFAILIGLFILFNAYKMGYEAVQSLLDKQLSVEDQYKIIKIASSISGVLNVHNLRTRQAGATKFIQLHIELDDDISLLNAHIITDQVEDFLSIAFPSADIHLHQEPISIGNKHRTLSDGNK